MSSIWMDILHACLWERARVRLPLATHLLLYRQEAIFKRAGHLIARSTQAQWVSECGAQLQPLVQALAEELRRHVVLHGGRGKLVRDDYSGYNQLLTSLTRRGTPRN